MVLSAHSEIAISPETHYFNVYARKIQRRRALLRPREYARQVQRFIEGPHVAMFGFDASERSALQSDILDQQPSHATLLGEVLRAYARKHGKAIWGEKTPGHAYFVSDILGLYPDARFVHIIRDPRDVTLSLDRVWWHRGNVIGHLKEWIFCQELPEREPQLTAENYAEVRFEDLVISPKETLIGLCKFLTVSFEERMLGDSRQTAPNFDIKTEPWKVNATQTISADNANKWRRTMPPRIQRIATALAREPLRMHGYDTDVSSPSAVDRLYALMLTAMNSIDVGYDRLLRHFRMRRMRINVTHNSGAPCED